MPSFQSTELQILPSKRKGAVTLLWAGRYYLHSKYDPLKEAQHQLSQIKLKNQRQLVIFIGAGLGYVLREFCITRANPALWFEPHSKITELAMGMEQGKLASLTHSERLRHFSDVPEDSKLQQIFVHHNNAEVVFYIHRASYTINPKYADIQQKIEDFLNRKSVNLATLARFDQLWMRNLMANFRVLLKAQPVKKLYNCAQNKPAIVCGAGPSLLEAMPHIRTLRKKLIVIATDTALSPLYSYGIDPDFVLYVDPQPINYHYTQWYQGKACFVVDPVSCYLGLRRFVPEKTFYFWSPFALAKVLFEFLGEEPGEIAFGGSVSTNAYDFAVRMGCNPILLAGQDLAFTDGLAHVRGAILEDLVRQKHSRTFQLELHNYRQLNAIPLRHIEAMNHKQLATNDKLLIFHQWCSKRMQADLGRGIKVVNMAKKGALIPNIQRAKWEDYEGLKDLSLPMLSFCQEKSNEKQNSRLFAKTMQSFASYLTNLLGEFSQYILIIKQGMQLAQNILEIQGQVSNPDKHIQKSLPVNYQAILKKMETEMETIDNKIINEQKLSALTSTILQKIIFQITGDLSSPSHHQAELDKKLSAAQHSHQLYTGLFEATNFYKRWLERTIYLLQQEAQDYK